MATDPNTQREFWLSGPVDGIPALLQPVAHALLQSRREVERITHGFPDALLWQKPGGLASAGFHLRHLTGVLDRLFSYARNEALSKEQLLYLKHEAEPGDDTATLVSRFSAQVDNALTQIKSTDPATLTETRGVGRAQIPSTVIGLLTHAAEHSMRHTGQLLVTVRWVTTTFA